MKRLWVFTFLIFLVLVPVEFAFGQGQVYGAAGVGMFAQDGQTKVGVFAAGDIKVSFDAAKGITMYDRVMILYSEFDGSYKAGATFFMVQKRLGVLRDLYLSFGPGFYYRIQDQQDEQNVCLRMELGTDILGNVGIDLGVDYIPSVPVDDDIDGMATTRWFFHGAINLYPRL
jgi:hypothetical protein